MKPIILITSYHVGQDELSEKKVRGKAEQDISICTWDYINAVMLSGGTPLVMPNIEGEDNIDALVKLADGILFSGGEDVNPKYFNEDIKVDNMTICDRRDRFEMMLAERILLSDIPVLGICRGMQLLNIAAGGNIYQDIGVQYGTALRHSNPQSRKADIIHLVNLLDETRLSDFYGCGLKGVNSFHHQAVKDLAPVLKASAYSEDKLLEAYEMEGRRFFVGVQWHPEMLFEKYPDELKLFKSFIESAKEYARVRCETRDTRLEI
ncbi:MAG: gamma-glutamyl-gamma-aminobutyrate hydrolase family protein [Clostridia bacterium]